MRYKGQKIAAKDSTIDALRRALEAKDSPLLDIFRRKETELAASLAHIATLQGDLEDKDVLIDSLRRDLGSDTHHPQRRLGKQPRPSSEASLSTSGRSVCMPSWTPG